MPNANAELDSRSALGMWDVVSIIVGIIVGATIFRSPADVFCNISPVYQVGGWQLSIPVWLTGLVLWVFVGLLSFVGALCYAELATTYPTIGGDYGFISRAYGRAAGFLFAWSEMAIIRTGASIVAMAYV